MKKFSHTLFQDNPLKSIKDDMCRRSALVEMIVDSINNLVTSDHKCVVYGIYGKWGEGKTTLLNFIKEKLLSQGKKDKINLIEFNPWIVDNNEALLREFFKSIIHNPDRQVRKAFEKYGSLVSFASYTILNAIIPGVGSSLSNGIKMAKEAITDTKDSLEELKRNASKSLLKSGRHLVIMIDDVDRLDKNEIHSILRLVRQVADFDNCIYLLSMDVDMVSKAIKDYYGNGEIQDGRAFIDKIVQVPILLPSIPEYNMILIVKDELRKILERYVNDNEISDIVDFVLPFIKNFRDCYRYCNQLSFVLPSLFNEVNIKDLCILEAIKLVSTESYMYIKSCREALLRFMDGDLYENNRILAEKERDDRYNNAISNITKGLDDAVRDKITTALVYLFDYNSWNDRTYLREKRLMTSVYFSRYFAQIVPDNFIPDKTIEELKSNLTNKTIDDVVLFLNNLIQRYSDEEVKRLAIAIIDRTNTTDTRLLNASIMAKALSLCNSAENYPSHIGIMPYDIARFVPNVIIKEYMFAQDGMYATSNAIENDLLDQTLIFIFEKADLNYCLNFLVASDAVLFNITSYDGRHALPILFDRFKALSFEDQIERSKVLLSTLFKYWKKIDIVSFNNYLQSILSYEKPLYLDLLDRLISEKRDDIQTFMTLFNDCLPLLNDRLEKDADWAKPHKSIEIYLANRASLV